MFHFFCLMIARLCFFFFFSSRRRHTRCLSDWSSDVCSSDLAIVAPERRQRGLLLTARIADIIRQKVHAQRRSFEAVADLKSPEQVDDGAQGRGQAPERRFVHRIPFGLCLCTQHLPCVPFRLCVCAHRLLRIAFGFRLCAQRLLRGPLGFCFCSQRLLRVPFAFGVCTPRLLAFPGR